MFRILVMLLSLTLAASANAYDRIDFMNDLDIHEEEYSTRGRIVLSCSYVRGQSFAPIIRNGFLVNDKLQHCTLSCIMAVGCSLRGSALIGLAKEVRDLMSKSGTADLKDLRANMTGLSQAVAIRRDRSEQPSSECFNRCEDHYENARPAPENWVESETSLTPEQEETLLRVMRELENE